MKKLQAFILVCISLISLISTSVYAGSRAGALTFTLGGGYDYFSSKRQIQNAGIPYGAIGYDFTNHWGVEGLLGFFTTYFDHNVPNDKEINGTLFSVDGVYHFTPYRIVEPYVLAGVGILGLSPNKEDEANNQGNINGGVGVQFFVDKVVALRVEARDFYTIVGGKNDVFLSGGVTFLLDLC